MNRNSYYDDLTLEQQVELVSSNAYMIQYIKNPPLDVQLEALKRDVSLIKYIDNPLLGTQLEAVRQNRRVIRFIKEHLDLSDDNLLKIHRELLEALILEDCLSNDSLDYLTKNGDKDIRRIIMEYKLSR